MDITFIMLSSWLKNVFEINFISYVTASEIKILRIILKRYNLLLPKAGSSIKLQTRIGNTVRLISFHKLFPCEGFKKLVNPLIEKTSYM